MSDVKEIVKRAFNDAANSKYCVNCIHSYIRYEDGNGYCKYYKDGKSFSMSHMKPITEFDTCEHWKEKIHGKKENS